MVKFDFRGSRIGSQFIATGDAVFDQRGQRVSGGQVNLGRGFRQDEGVDDEFERWWASLPVKPNDPRVAARLAWRTQASGDY